MDLKRFALNAQEAGDAGDGATGGGSSEGGEQDKRPKDGDVVPKTQFLAAIKSANEKFDSLKSQFEELKAKSEAKPVEQRRYTRAELTAMVAAAQITQDQADAQIEYQVREDAKADATRVATETVSAAQRKGFIDSEIARYVALAPEILDDADETRQRIKDEYKFLVESLGDRNGVDTQLKAIRAVLGPIDKLELARRGEAAHESHRDTGGGGGGGGSRAPKTLVESLTVREKDYYEGMIKKGMYKDWKAVEEELAFARPDVRRKAGARV